MLNLAIPTFHYARHGKNRPCGAAAAEADDKSRQRAAANPELTGCSKETGIFSRILRRMIKGKENQSMLLPSPVNHFRGSNHEFGYARDRSLADSDGRQLKFPRIHNWRTRDWLPAQRATSSAATITQHVANHRISPGKEQWTCIDGSPAPPLLTRRRQRSRYRSQIRSIGTDGAKRRILPMDCFQLHN